MRRKCIFWKMLSFAGVVPTFAVLLGGLYLWQREDWLVSDWVAWTVLMAMLVHPILLTGLGVTAVSLLRLMEERKKKIRSTGAKTDCPPGCL